VPGTQVSQSRCVTVKGALEQNHGREGRLELGGVLRDREEPILIGESRR
jgi:hypothetical protein